MDSVTGSRLEVTRGEILAFRRRANGLNERVPGGEGSLRRAAWAGLQDSMPRFSVFVVAACDLAVFSLSRLPDDAKGRQRAEDLAARLAAVLDGGPMTHAEAGRAVGVQNHNSLRYAAATGTVLIRWDGARQPTLWMVPPPEIDPFDARLELARRYLHVYGPATPESFVRWAGIGRPQGAAAFAALGTSLTPVRTLLGDAWILAEDEAAFRAAPSPTASARLLPSGDAYFLHHEQADRDLLVPDPDRRDTLWTPRVWPGGLLVGGELAGTWRRANTVVTVQPWRPLSASERDAIMAEAESLPLPGAAKRVDCAIDTV